MKWLKYQYLMQSYFTYQVLRISKRNFWKQPRFTMHRTLCKIARKRSVFIITTIKLPLYLLATFNECISMQKKSKIWIRLFKIITKASRYKCLYYFITANVISNFFFIKYNLPTNWLFLLSLKMQRQYVCYYPFLCWFIYAFTYDTLVFLSFLSAYTRSLHCLTPVRCMVNFRPMHG